MCRYLVIDSRNHAPRTKVESGHAITNITLNIVHRDCLRVSQDPSRKRVEEGTLYDINLAHVAFMNYSSPLEVYVLLVIRDGKFAPGVT